MLRVAASIAASIRGYASSPPSSGTIWLPSTSGRPVTSPTSVASDRSGAWAGPMESSSRSGCGTAALSAWITANWPARSWPARERIRFTPSTA